VDHDSFGRAGIIADHAATPDAALQAWIASDYKDEGRGPVTFSLSTTQDTSKAGGTTYQLFQTGQSAGDVVLRQDQDGWFVASGHPCIKWSDATTTTTDPGNNDLRRIDDPVAGLSYDKPAGWRQQSDLLDFLTTGIAFGPEKPDINDTTAVALVAGTSGHGTSTTVQLTPSNIDRSTVPFAKSFSEFVFAGSGHDDVLTDERTTVDGHDAWHVRLRFVPEGGGRAGAIDAFTIVRDGDVSFVVAIGGNVEALDARVAPIIASIKVTP